MFFDSHTHYDDPRFDEDRDSLLSSMKSGGVDCITNIGVDLNSSKVSAELAKKYDFVYATAGVHPHDAKDMTDDVLEEIAHLTQEKKVVAIGEIGLDYHYDYSPRDTQKYWFKKQMHLARELDIPVVIHSREAMEETIKICRENPVCAGVIHCFSGSAESARIFLDMGYFISFAGPITFKNARSLPEIARLVPDDRILIETDSPYLSPEPHRGERNSSLNIRHVAEKLAEIRGVSVEEIARITKENAKTLYRIR